ncbi:flagellin domain-containing protein [Delftia acidovorans]|uniref:flagellin domain-containing protein n=1 Tax=Delftia acidovorans TaxID=80866 RepID=UPI00192AE228|nr:flagellin domain-containing protein [Delftia acidovorans]
MASIINTNLVSLNAQRNLSTSQSSLSTTMQRLSSGLRVNSAKDDAAGLAIAERMNAQVRGMNVAMRNANDGISMAQTAEGALGKLSENLQRMRELAVQAANDTNGTTDRGSLDKEFKQLSQEIARIVTSTSFNGRQLLNSSSPTVFQVGANTGADNQITISAVDLSDAAALNVDGATTPPSLVGALGSLAGTGSTPTSTAGDARLSMAAIDTALDLVNNTRATFGAAQNRFEAVISNLQVAAENTSAARSRIMDADFAAETANLSRTQILQQAGTAMVAQANQLPQSVLKLIQ